MTNPLRLLIHDYAGHPFQVQLSRSLAKRGHTVVHAYCGSLQTTPQAALRQTEDAPECFSVRPVELDEPLSKNSLWKRRRQEIEYGRRLVQLVADVKPDAIISANTPLDAQTRLIAASRRRDAQFVYWLQDMLGIGAHRVLRRKIPLLGSVVGRYYVRMERSLLRQSDAIVAITEDFCPVIERMGVPSERIHVIHNWTPLEEMPSLSKDNSWAHEHGLPNRPTFLYAGTLGMKHNPDLLRQLAHHLQDADDAQVVVISEGQGAEWLKEEKDRHQLENLKILGFQPYEQMPEVLGAADVLVAILEPDAGVFSVPSKVLTYLCAGRPLLLAVPPENLAARIVAEHRAGLVVPPTDVEGFVANGLSLLKDPNQREELGGNARKYAETHFDIERITDRFETIIQG